MPDDERSRDRATLQTVDRALEILLTYTETRVEWGASELAAELGLSTSSAQRMLAALAERGFLRRVPYTRRYRLGPALWRMSNLWERTGGLSALANPVLEPLVEATGRTAVFAIPDGLHVRVVGSVDGPLGPARAHSFMNGLYPAHAGVAARAYFAFLDRDARRDLFRDRPLGRFSGSRSWTRRPSPTSSTRPSASATPCRRASSIPARGHSGSRSA